MKKINSKIKRSLRNRKKLKDVNTDRYRIAVFKSLKNISAQIIDNKVNKTIVSASTMEKNLKKDKKNKTELSKFLGEILLKEPQKKLIKSILTEVGINIMVGSRL